MGRGKIYRKSGWKVGGRFFSMGDDRPFWHDPGADQHARNGVHRDHQIHADGVRIHYPLRHLCGNFGLPDSCLLDTVPVGTSFQLAIDSRPETLPCTVESCA